MDYKEYYIKRQNGTFLVHFPNFHRLTEEEIRQRFALYGNVMSVDTRGQVSGLCFVSYENEVDVYRCLDGFRHQKDIRILKHKSQSKTKEPKDSKQMQQADTDGSEKGSSKLKNKMVDAKAEGHGDCQGNKKSNTDWNNEGTDLKIKGPSDEQDRVKSYQKVSQGSSKPVGKSEKKVVTPKVEHGSPGSVKSELKFKKKVADPKSFGSTKPNLKSKKKALDPKIQTAIPPLMAIDLIESVPKRNIAKEQYSVASYTDSKPNSIFDDNISFNDLDLLPQHQPIMQGIRLQKIKSLTSSSPTTIQSFKTNNTRLRADSNGQTRLAQEVIVANIDDTFGIHYILHLTEKFNPIAASMMKTTSRSKIRYCHIYFANWKEALGTQQEFDDYSLEGKKLIVLTSQNLIREALAA